jgi:hypothetical protein
MNGYVGLRDDARVGALLAAQIARLFAQPRVAASAQYQEWPAGLISPAALS